MRKSKMKNPSKRKSIFRPLLLIICILVFLYAASAFLVMPLYTRHWQRIRVPDVTNLSVAAAEKVITHSKLEPMRNEIKYDDSMPQGYVSFQNPVANTFVKKGRRIYLVASKGKRPVIVPKLIGVNLRDVRFNVVEHQLELGEITYEFDRYYPEDVVISQAIEPDTEIIAGTLLNITVSLGEEPADIYIPNMFGMTLEQAELALKKALLTRGRIGYSEWDGEPHRLIYQSMKAGERATRSDTVNIALSIPLKDQQGSVPW